MYPEHPPSEPPRPTKRRLRGYAFDPSLATTLETAVVSEVVFNVPWESLNPGPAGEYIEVVDFDPASGCFYMPVDLDHGHILAQDGLKPSERNPQFHQQMVYAAAMTTIERFERALGRRTFWRDRLTGDGSQRGVEYVGRLRIYPHALRMANAYYSRRHAALLFGYFPSTDDRSSGQYPGGMVFTCLSHDVVAHETTHALLDGLHEYFMEATNPDVLAFHEAFADVVALFQRFSFPEVLAHQIARTRGDLSSENLLAQLARQFGHARGNRGALRDAIGGYDPVRKTWVRHEPDPTVLDRTLEVHARGAVLVAAVFDAFLSIFGGRTRDLVRIATDGTGVLRQGELPPALLERLAHEASKSADHVLSMCLRALDYCPPIDLTFGDYLRALITADMDLMPEDQRGYRVAFIEAFSRRGIYPLGVRTLSQDSLRWPRPADDPSLPPGTEQTLREFVWNIDLRGQMNALSTERDRWAIWERARTVRQDMHSRIARELERSQVLQKVMGFAFTDLDLPPGMRIHRSGEPFVSIGSVRYARRVAQDGHVLNRAFITILQREQVEHEGVIHIVRGGSTLIIDLDDGYITYAVRKGLHDMHRLRRTVDFQQAYGGSLSATYFGESEEPFAALHHIGA